ncbi:hypothetical protein HGRIS_014105 [Hohenbuehelia grisea]|uniref:Uncharacterized protein n=1 Tax=Hohenbuehelia grisea TaxID=104357 RepID=A0ABR3JSJ4_9AGAR
MQMAQHVGYYDQPYLSTGAQSSARRRRPSRHTPRIFVRNEHRRPHASQTRRTNSPPYRADEQPEATIAAAPATGCHSLYAVAEPSIVGLENKSLMEHPEGTPSPTM